MINEEWIKENDQTTSQLTNKQVSTTTTAKSNLDIPIQTPRFVLKNSCIYLEFTIPRQQVTCSKSTVKTECVKSAQI